jgi:hypothetical protein
MGFLSKKDIQKVDDIQIEVVEVPEWGGSVRVKGLGGLEGDLYTKSLVKGKGKKANVDLDNMTAKLVARCLVDDKGKRMFNQMEVAELGQKSAAALKRIYKVAAVLSGIDEEEQEDILKNSESNQTNDSGTD